MLANAALKPTPDEIGATAAAFQEFLRIRGSSGLFRMGSLTEVQANLRFLNTGAQQVPGLLVMELSGYGYGPYAHIAVVWNATTATQIYKAAPLAGLPLALHPIQRSGADPVVREAAFDRASGTLTVPALTTAVFVSAR